MIKKFSFIALALLLACGSAFAAGIPLGVDPGSGPEVWTQEVYNDSGSTLTSGSVVIWDYTDSDMFDLDDRKAYITTTTTADDISVAGVMVTPSCANGDACAIAIYGPVRARATGTVTAGLAIGTSTTAGVVTGYANTGTDDAAVGWSVDANTLADSATGGTDIMVLFVNPSVQAD
jgi:hypothetical protein